jgi:hypothetical protein
VLAIIGALGAALPQVAAAQKPESFSPEAYFDTESTADDLKVADVNGDGHLDVVVLDSGAGKLFTYPGNGDGTFQPRIGSTLGVTHPAAFALGDVNGDGRLDAVVADDAGAAIVAFPGAGDGTFVPAAPKSVLASPNDVELADVNVDGYLDAVFTSANAVTVVYGNGDGTFGSVLSLGQTHNPDKVLLPDLNGDGWPDLVLREKGLSTSSLGIVRSSGPGTFSPTQWVDFAGQLFDIAVGETDGDGHPDLAVSVPAVGGGVFKLVNDGAGGFPYLTGIASVPQQPVLAVHIADADGDGDGDFVVLYDHVAMIGITDLYAQQAPTAATSRAVSTLEIGDFNGDGIVDLAATVTSPGAFGVWLTQAVPPVTAIALAPAAPDGTNGWYRTPVHVTVSATDNAGGSGVALTSCSLDPAAPPASLGDLEYPCALRNAGADVAGDGVHTVYAASMDQAGNVEALTSATLRVDRTAPVVTCPATPPSFVRFTTAPVVADVSDPVSGPLTATASATADTSAGGTQSVLVTGFDMAGNSTQVSCSYIVTGLPGDRDGDDMRDEDEEKFGLDPDSADGESGAAGDPDGDGLTNIQELNGTPQSHPRGFYAQQFAEGSTGFFETAIGIFNAGGAPAHVFATLLPEAGGAASIESRAFTLAPHARTTLDVNKEMGASTAGLGVATRIESDQPVAAMRDMRWREAGGAAYGSTLERGADSASTRWYFAEGATGAFSMYLLLSNPGATEAHVTIDALPESGEPLSSTVTLPAFARKTIDMKSVPGLSAASFSSIVSSDVPIVAERAMYAGFGPRVFDAGTGGLGMTALDTSWTFAEGATGFFHAFLLLGNPGGQDAQVTVRYAFPDGTWIDKAHLVPARARRTIDAAAEDASLAVATFSMRVTSDRPVMAERAMWWGTPWYEGGVSPGTAETGTVWAIGEGREGGADLDSTFVLVSNASADAGSVSVTVVDDQGASQSRTYALAGGARMTLRISDEFAGMQGTRFSVLVESVDGDGSAVPIVVECARYQSGGGRFGEGGGAALATRIRRIG